MDAKIRSSLKVFIFVSEDGSRDNTRSEVLEAAKIVKTCQIVLAEPSDRLGYSRGVLRGISECNTELIAFMDADGQCDPADFESLMEKVQGGKIVVGHRNPRNDSKTRIVYSKAFGVIYRFFGGPKRKDPSSPFVVCYLRDIRFLVDTTPQLSFGFWWEFQSRIHKRGIGVVETPINHRIRSAGKTQVYTLPRIPRIVYTHLVGLYKLHKELNS
jgi:glycosyltransferase involved in cell wall biosynthesis